MYIILAINIVISIVVIVPIVSICAGGGPDNKGLYDSLVNILFFSLMIIGFSYLGYKIYFVL